MSQAVAAGKDARGDHSFPLLSRDCITCSYARCNNEAASDGRT
jgi:hypothetical protein